MAEDSLIEVVTLAVVDVDVVELISSMTPLRLVEPPQGRCEDLVRRLGTD